MDKNNKTLLIAVLIMLLALVSLNFNNISGRASGSGDNQHPLALSVNSNACRVGTQIIGTVSGNFRGVTHDTQITIRRDSLTGPVVGRDKVSRNPSGAFSEQINWNCESGTHRYYTVMRSRTGDHKDSGVASVRGR